MAFAIGEFLRRRKAEILSAWEADVRKRLPEMSELSRPALVDAMPEVIERLANDLGGPGASPSVAAAAQHHGEHRAEQELPLPRVVDEYRALQSVVLSLMRDEIRGSRDAQLRGEVPGAERRDDDADALVRFVVSLDDAVAESIRRYVEARDERLTEIEHRLRLALDSAAIGTWDLDVRSGVFTWDDRCRAIFGWARESAGAYDRFRSAVHPDDRARVAETARAALNRVNGGEYRAEYRIHRGDDHAVRWVAARGAALFDARGDAVRFVGVVLDVTEAKAAEEMRERFMAILGHDLRTPLGAVSLAATQMLRSQALPGEFQRSAAVIARAADRMTRMTRDLLDLARGRLGGVPVTPRSMDAGQVCRSVIEETRMLHPDRAIDLRLEGDLAGRWDADRVAQAVSNLVANAVAHGRDPIVVRARSDNDAVTIEVTNAGPPIPEREQRELFEPFRRREATRSAHAGLGLGLYIVSEIARAHGGATTVRSDDTGTTFTLRLPQAM